MYKFIGLYSDELFPHTRILKFSLQFSKILLIILLLIYFVQ